MNKKELQQEVESLQDQILQLKSKNRLLNDLATFYADPLNEWDHGKKAVKVIKSLSKGYKPINGDLAIMFKEKEVYPFIEFSHYIDDRLGDDDET